MAVASARNIVNLKESHFERENARIDKYTYFNNFKSKLKKMLSDLNADATATGGGPPQAESMSDTDKRFLAIMGPGFGQGVPNVRVNPFPNMLADELPAQLSELGLRPRAMSKPSYTIRTLTKDDEEKALKFLRRFFFRDEPMNQAVNLLETSDYQCAELEEYSASSIGQGHSVVAVDENGDFVGLIINGLVNREDVDYSDKSEDCPNSKFRRILKVLGHLDREAKIWEKLPESCQKVMEVRIASTDSSWRGRGLMRVLCEEAERIARAVGAGAMRMDTTSAYSAAAAQRLGYKPVYEVAYADLSYAPQPPAPHLVAKVYIKEL